MRLNLGCGYHTPSGWVNADNNPSIANPDVVADGFCLPWDENFFSQVMMCHTLEHIALNDVEKMMREVHRVLKPGGQLLVICPDVMSLICLYTNVYSTGRNVKAPGESLYWDLSQEVWTGKTTNLPPGEQVSIESVLRHLVGSIVLEDDPSLELPRSDHKWNTYGSRIMNRLSSVFDDLELLTTDGYYNLEFGTATWVGGVDVLWEDDRNGNKWDTTGWMQSTCGVLATK